MRKLNLNVNIIWGAQAAKQKSASEQQVKTNGVQHLLHTLSETESNEDQDWKPEIPFGNVSNFIYFARFSLLEPSINDILPIFKLLGDWSHYVLTDLNEKSSFKINTFTTPK